MTNITKHRTSPHHIRPPPPPFSTSWRRLTPRTPPANLPGSLCRSRVFRSSVSCRRGTIILKDSNEARQHLHPVLHIPGHALTQLSTPAAAAASAAAGFFSPPGGVFPQVVSYASGRRRGGGATGAGVRGGVVEAPALLLLASFYPHPLGLSVHHDHHTVTEQHLPAVPLFPREEGFTSGRSIVEGLGILLSAVCSSRLAPQVLHRCIASLASTELKKIPACTHPTGFVNKRSV